MFEVIVQMKGDIEDFDKEDVAEAICVALDSYDVDYLDVRVK